MLKEKILDLIDKFEAETWKYITDDDKLNKDMEYIYSIEKELKNVDEANAEPIYDKLVSLIGIIRFKHGFEKEIITNIDELKFLKELVDSISFNSKEIINQYNYISTVYEKYINNIKNIDFIKNKYAGIEGKEGLFLAVESLKTLISEDYKQLLGETKINDVLIDCVKLNEGVTSLERAELKYKDIISQTWEKTLSNEVHDNEKFDVLFSNISGGGLSQQAEMLINRPSQSSCSLISSEFIATYGSNNRRIGFIYPNNSEIITASAYDLGSNVFGEGFKNKEKGTILATPKALEKVGKARAISNGEDLYSSSSYNEVLINAKPCGIMLIGLGEKDLNIDYEEAKNLAMEMNLPIYYIDTMKYKKELSEVDKDYIAFHSVLSFLGISRDDFASKIAQEEVNKIYELINVYKEDIVNTYLALKSNGQVSKEAMCRSLSNIIDTSRTNSKNTK